MIPGAGSTPCASISRPSGSLHESEASRAIVRRRNRTRWFSEDLDFSQVSCNGYDPASSSGNLAGFDSTVRWIDRRPVQVAWIRTASLLAEALSGHPEQKLAIKVEIDTRPPAGATVLRSVVTRHFTFVIRHHDLPSLMAGKLHALLARGYPKGRDWFDLVWYRSRRPPVAPNVQLLQRALDQTRDTQGCRAAAWRSLLQARLADLDTGVLVRDVAPFLERPTDAAFLERVNLQAVLAT